MSPVQAGDFAFEDFSSRSSVNLHGTETKASRMTQVTDLGVGLVRYSIDWNTSIDDGNGNYNWSGSNTKINNTTGFNKLLTLYRSHPDYGTQGTFYQNAIVDQARRDAFADFCEALAAQYDDDNVIWEVWNEPNLSTFWKNDGTSNSNSDQYAIEYTALVKAAAPALKAGDPNSTVVIGSVSTIWWGSWYGGSNGSLGWLQKCVDEGILIPEVDGVSVHPYNSANANGGRPEQAIHQYNLLRTVVGDTPIYNSEVGYRYDRFKDRPDGTIADDAEGRLLQAAFYVRQNMVDRYSDVEITNWYTFRNGSHNTFSMVGGWNGGAGAYSPEREAYQAGEIMHTQLDGYTYQREILLDRDGSVTEGDESDFALLFEDASGNQKIVAWSTHSDDPSVADTHSVKIPVGSANSPVTVVDLYGTSSTLTSDGNGDVTVDISYAPQYIHVVTALPTSTQVIVDNSDGSPSVDKSGTTAVDGRQSNKEIKFRGANFDRFSGNNAYVKYIPDLPAAGSYDIYVWFNDRSNYANDAQYDVAHEGGTTTYSMDQRSHGGRWMYLATHSFPEGQNANRSVTVRTNDNGKTVSADSVMFVLSGSGTVPTSQDGNGDVTFGTDYISYGSQDGQGGQPSNVTVSGDGSSVTLTGNAWKAFPLGYVVSPSTVLEVTVDASDTGEIMGVVLDNDQNYSNSRRGFLLGGSDVPNASHDSWSWTVVDYDTDGPGAVTYVIPVGSYFTGTVNHMAFVADDDANASSDVTFSNVRLYEESNTAPVVNAGADASATVGTALQLSGSASDDGLPNPPGALTTTWSQVSGPGTVTFGDASSLSTTADFSAAGTYVLRLTADDAGLSTQDELTVTVSGSSGGGGGTITHKATGSSGQIAATSSGASFSFDAAGGNFIAVFISGGNNANGFLNGNLTVSGSYGGTPLTFERLSTDGSRNFAAVLYLTNPPTGSNTLSVNVATDDSGGDPFTDGAGAFEVGVVSFSGVDTGEPLVGSESWSGINQTDQSFLSGADGDISAGDAVAVATIARHIISHPRWEPSTLGMQLIYTSTSLGGNAQHHSSYTVLEAGDLADLAGSGGADDLTLYNQGSTRPGSNVGIIINAGAPVNAAPSVVAGADFSTETGQAASLSGSASDDGLPNPPGTLTTTWTKQSGPGTVTFGDASSPATTASFDTAGTYVLRLTADDSDVSAYDEVTATVTESSGGSRTVVFEASASSGRLDGTNSGASFNFDAAGGDFVAVFISGGNNSTGSIRGNLTITGDFGGAPLVMERMSTDGDRNFSAVLYVVNPPSGTQNLVVNVATDDSSGDPFDDSKVYFEVGIVSYSGVDGSSPIAGGKSWNGNNQTQTTLTSTTSGSISAGDAVAYAGVARNSIADPYWAPLTTSSQTVYNEENLGGHAQHNCGQAVLQTGDLSGSGSDELILYNQGNTRPGGNVAIVVNALE